MLKGMSASTARLSQASRPCNSSSTISNKDGAYPNGEKGKRRPCAHFRARLAINRGIRASRFYARLAKSLVSGNSGVYFPHGRAIKDAKSFRLWIITLALLALAAWTYFRK